MGTIIQGFNHLQTETAVLCQKVQQPAVRKPECSSHRVDAGLGQVPLLLYSEELGLCVLISYFYKSISVLRGQCGKWCGVEQTLRKCL